MLTQKEEAVSAKKFPRSRFVEPASRVEAHQRIAHLTEAIGSITSQLENPTQSLKDTEGWRRRAWHARQEKAAERKRLGYWLQVQQDRATAQRERDHEVGGQMVVVRQEIEPSQVRVSFALRIAAKQLVLLIALLEAVENYFVDETGDRLDELSIAAARARDMVGYETLNPDMPPILKEDEV